MRLLFSLLFGIKNMKVVTFLALRVQFLLIVFSQLQALVVSTYYVLVTDLLSPRSEKFLGR